MTEGLAWVIGAFAAGPLILVAIRIFKELRPSERTPPMPEEAAKTYATKQDLRELDMRLAADMARIRTEIAENDTKAEHRSVATHRRMDAVYRSLSKNNKSLGIIIGAMVTKGNLPSSVIFDGEGNEGEQPC